MREKGKENRHLRENETRLGLLGGGRENSLPEEDRCVEKGEFGSVKVARISLA